MFVAVYAHSALFLLISWSSSTKIISSTTINCLKVIIARRTYVHERCNPDNKTKIIIQK